jgi:hypothetical protein
MNGKSIHPPSRGALALGQMRAEAHRHEAREAPAHERLHRARLAPQHGGHLVDVEAEDADQPDRLPLVRRRPGQRLARRVGERGVDRGDDQVPPTLPARRDADIAATVARAAVSWSDAARIAAP